MPESTENMDRAIEGRGAGSGERALKLMKLDFLADSV